MEHLGTPIVVSACSTNTLNVDIVLDYLVVLQSISDLIAIFYRYIILPTFIMVP